jgi:hypothetical protein
VSAGEAIPVWCARAYAQAAEPSARTGRGAGVEVFGFGHPDTCELAGSPEQIARALAALLSSFDRAAVLAAIHESGRFGVVLEVEPCEGRRPVSPRLGVAPRLQRPRAPVGSAG